MKGFMAIKVDLEKAYDSLSWKFIKDTLQAINILEKLRTTIMDCISSSSIRVLWNGEATDAFPMGRGIRQGCHLSRYLFVLCIEQLGHIINDMV